MARVSAVTAACDIVRTVLEIARFQGRAISEAFGAAEWMKISTSIRIGNISSVGTVALVLRGLWGLSVDVLFYFGFIVNLASLVLSRRCECLGPRSGLSRKHPTILPITGKMQNCCGPQSGCVGLVVQAADRRGVAAGACGSRWECSEWVRRRRRGCLSGPICIEPHDQHPRNLDPWISLPRHPRPNFTESRVRSRALARPDQSE